MDCEIDPSIVATSGQVADLENWRGLARRCRFQRRRKLATGHQLGEAVTVNLVCGIGSYLLTVSEHRYALGDLHHLFQFVADEDGSDPMALQPAHRLEKRIDFVVGE